MSLVIVAIPEEQDRVWKISSEKVPHLTLLYLGDEADANTAQIMQFVQHAVTLSEHGPFYLDVDHRGTLGDAEADVIFFSKRSWNLKWIKQFRGQLLQNGAIRTAFDGAEQHMEAPQEWLPHLTLGYPESPANKPDEDGFDHPLYSVAFDRIALWDGDFEGPEFRLEWPDREFEGDLAVAYSDAKKAALMHYTQNDPEGLMDTGELGAEFIEHFGVKGMKWGVRKDQATGAARSAASTAATKAKAGGQAVARGAKRAAVAVGDAHFESRVESGSARTAVINAANKSYKKEVLPALNAKPEYANARKLTHRLTHPRDPLTKQYRREATNSYLENLEKSANSITNSSGTRQYTIRERGNDLPAEGGDIPRYFWEVSSRNIKHAADNFEGTTLIEVIMDEDGFITDLKEQPSEMAQDALHEITVAQGATFVGNFGEALEHYGVKGMRWGIRNRKGTPTAVAPQATSKVPHGKKRKTKIEVDGGENHDAAEDAIRVAEAHAKLKRSGPKALSNQELREVANRIRLENEVELLTSSKGKKFVRKQFETEAQNLGRKAVKTGGRKVIRKGGKAAALALL